MATRVQLENGRIFEFENPPTPEDIDFAVGQSALPTQKKKSLFRAVAEAVGRSVGIQDIPSINQLAQSKHPFLATALGTAEDVATIPAHFANQYLINYPRSVSNQLGLQFPEHAQSPVADVLAHSAGIVGGLMSPINKVLGLKVLKGAPMVSKIATGALIGGAYAPNEGPGNIKQRIAQAEIGGLVPPAIEAGVGVSKGVGNLVSKIPQITENIAGGIVNRIIRTLPREFSFGKNPGLGVAREGIVANSPGELLKNVRVAQRVVGQKIGSVLSKNNVPVNIESAIAPIDSAMQEAAKMNDSALVNRLSNAKRALTQKLEIGQSQVGENVIQTTGDRDLSNIMATDAAKLKTTIGKMARWTENKTHDAIVNVALRKSYGIVDRAIDQAVPSVKALNARYANLLSAEHSIQRYQLLDMAGKLGGHLVPATHGVAVAILSGLSHVGNPSLAGIGVAGIEEALKIPSVGTRVANWLSKASEFEKATLWKNNPELKQAIQNVASTSKNLLLRTYGRNLAKDRSSSEIASRE